MNFFLSKLIPQFFYPLALFILLSWLSGVFLWYSKKRLGAVLLFCSLLSLWALSSPFLSDQLGKSLERVYLPVSVENSSKADAIVILGGCIGAADYPRLTPDLGSASDRVLHAVRLYRAGLAPLVIAVGGAIPWLGDSPEASAISAVLQEWGVPRDSIIIEDQSRNTYENAIYTKRLLEKRGARSILLVTSALHMPRALATFQSNSINAFPSPTDYQVVDREQMTILDFLPDAEALYNTTRAIREYLGFLMYYWRGYIR